MQSLSDIAVFVEVVDSGSFTAAAERLEISKAAASKYVSRLEGRLGSRLLQRTTRRLTLTEAGRALYDVASGALAQLEAAEGAVLELSGEPRGRLRVTAPVYFGAAFLVPMLESFLERHPAIELELDLDNRIVDLVAEGFDVGIRITQLQSSSLIARRLAESRMVTVASPAYIARHGEPREPRQLADHDCLTYTLDRTPGEWPYLDRDGSPLAVRIGGRVRCNSDEGLKSAALEGLGIVQFPEIFVGGELAAGSLVRLLADFEPPPGHVYAVFPSRDNLAPKVRVFVDFVAARLAATLNVPANA